MKIQCFVYPDYEDGKLNPVPVEVTLLKETKWASGGYSFVVRHTNKGEKRGATSRFNPDGFEYYTCDFDPRKEIAEWKDRKTNPNKYPFPQFPHFFETPKDSYDYFFDGVEKDLKETLEEFQRAKKNIKDCKNKLKLNL